MFLDFSELEKRGIKVTLVDDNKALILEFEREWSEVDRKNYRRFVNGIFLSPREQDELMDATHRIQMINVLRNL